MKPVQFQLRILPALLVLLLLYGCGGSGSSGFDAAFFLEQDAIDNVTEGGGCVDVDGTEICAPDEDLGGGGITIPNPPAALVIDPPSGAELSCVPSEAEESCVFNLSIQQANFPEGVQFFAVVRFQDDTSFWSIGPSPFSLSIDDSSTLELMVRVSELKPGKSALMQIAVLVYLPESDLPPQEPGDHLLGDFEADRVYAVKDITVTATVP